jgi:hypothetical protein
MKTVSSSLTTPTPDSVKHQRPTVSWMFLGLCLSPTHLPIPHLHVAQAIPSVPTPMVSLPSVLAPSYLFIQNSHDNLNLFTFLVQNPSKTTQCRYK